MTPATTIRSSVVLALVLAGLALLAGCQKQNSRPRGPQPATQAEAGSSPASQTQASPAPKAQAPTGTVDGPIKVDLYTPQVLEQIIDSWSSSPGKSSPAKKHENVNNDAKDTVSQPRLTQRGQ